MLDGPTSANKARGGCHAQRVRNCGDYHRQGVRQLPTAARGGRLGRRCAGRGNGGKGPHKLIDITNVSTYLGPKGVEYDIKVMRTFDREVEMDIVLLTMFEKYCKVHFKNHVKIVLNNNEKIEPQHTGNIAVSMRLTEAPAQTTLYASNYPEARRQRKLHLWCPKNVHQPWPLARNVNSAADLEI